MIISSLHFVIDFRLRFDRPPLRFVHTRPDKALGAKIFSFDIIFIIFISDTLSFSLSSFHIIFILPRVPILATPTDTLAVHARSPFRLMPTFSMIFSIILFSFQRDAYHFWLILRHIHQRCRFCHAKNIVTRDFFSFLSSDFSYFADLLPPFEKR